MAEPRKIDWAKLTRIGVTAQSRRPGLGRQAVRSGPRSSGRLLVITLADFALGAEPVFGFVARLEPATLRHQISEAANLVLNIDWEQIGSRFRSYHLRLAGFSCGHSFHFAVRTFCGSGSEWDSSFHG